MQRVSKKQVLSKIQMEERIKEILSKIINSYSHLDMLELITFIFIHLNEKTDEYPLDLFLEDTISIWSLKRKNNEFF